VKTEETDLYQQTPCTPSCRGFPASAAMQTREASTRCPKASRRSQ